MKAHQIRADEVVQIAEDELNKLKPGEYFQLEAVGAFTWRLVKRRREDAPV